MATFKYSAFDDKEKKISGYVNAVDQVEALSVLQSRGLNPLSIRESEQKKSNIKISTKDLSIFTKQMSALLAAGTPIEVCLDLLINQSNNKFSQVLLTILEDITEGKSLSAAMKKYPRIFDDIYISTIHAGESSAALPEVFSDLADYLDKETKVRAQVTGSLAYPTILFTVSILVIYALLSYVLPQVVEQFISSNVSLPVLTQILLQFSSIFPYIIFLIFSSIGILFFILKTNFISHNTKIKFSKYFLKIPIFGQIILFDQTARFCSSMRLMTKAGLNTVDSLRISKDTFKNRFLRSEVEIIVNKVVSGTSISQAFSKSKAFPSVFIQLLSSGDAGSQISEMFDKIKNFLDQEVESRRNILLTLLQPIIIITMGIFVMLIVLAIMLPLLQMNNLILDI
tara:strand:- start:3374 stop:4567 length:1194 start_codon:yes stop_codon:yes gene_type:complete